MNMSGLTEMTLLIYGVILGITFLRFGLEYIITKIGEWIES